MAVQRYIVRIEATLEGGFAITYWEVDGSAQRERVAILNTPAARTAASQLFSFVQNRMRQRDPDIAVGTPEIPPPEIPIDFSERN